MYAVRTAGSHGACDIVAMFPEFTWAIQAKAYAATKADREAVEVASRATAARWALVSLLNGKIHVEAWKGGKPWRIKVPGL